MPMPFLLMLMAFVGQPDDALKAELQKLQGTWAGVSMEVNGQRNSSDDFKDSTMAISGNSLSLLYKGKAESRGTLKLDPTKSPKHVDVTFVEGTHKGKKALGLYKIEGDQLTFCWTLVAVVRERPTEFATSSGSGLAMIVQKKAK